jgi:hypothetical protein
MSANYNSRFFLLLIMVSMALLAIKSGYFNKGLEKINALMIHAKHQ